MKIAKQALDAVQQENPAATVFQFYCMFCECADFNLFLDLKTKQINPACKKCERPVITMPIPCEVVDSSELPKPQ